MSDKLTALVEDLSEWNHILTKHLYLFKCYGAKKRIHGDRETEDNFFGHLTE